MLQREKLDFDGESPRATTGPSSHTMKTSNDQLPDQRSLSRHILPSSGTMVGVCVTLIGLVKIVETRTGPSRVDEYAALTTFLFLASAVASYISMRHPEHPRLSARCEMIAD